MSTLKFKSKIEVPGIHLKGKDKNGSDIGTQVRVNSISLYADADCEQLNMSASRILLENEIDGIHTTKIAPDLIELTSEDLETGQETTTSITSTGIATNNITRQNTNKSITIGSTSSTPVDIKYLNTNQVKTGAAIINSVYNIHTNQYSELVATDMQTNTDTLIIPRYTNTIRHPVLRYDTITANQLQIIKQEIVWEGTDTYEIEFTVKLYFAIPDNTLEAIKNSEKSDDRTYTYEKVFENNTLYAYTTFREMHDFPNESYNRAPVLFMDITYQDSIPLQEALDSMERITYRYRSNKWFISSYSSAEFGMLIATVPKSYGTTIQDIALHEHWGFFYSQSQPMLPCRVSTDDDNQPYLIMYPMSESAGVIQIDIPEEEDTTTYLEFINQ